MQQNQWKFLAVLCLMTLISVPAMAGQIGLKDEGAGMYTGPSVAFQMSTFTINKNTVSCGVGTVSAGPGQFGPFEMIMYSLSVDSYTVNRNVPRHIMVTGKMRSTTRVAGVIVEDTDGSLFGVPPHDYIAVGEDKDSPQQDRFTVHFVTPFWNPTNPMCAPSELVEGWCQFGDDAFLGNIVVDGQNF